MSKENLLGLAPGILKYLIVLVAMWAIFILYVAKLNQIEPSIDNPDSNMTGVASGNVQKSLEANVSSQESISTEVIADQSVNTSQVSEALETELLSAFQRANQAILEGDKQTAASIFLALIDQHPELPEPYANLASLQAENNQLGDARATLLQGLQSHASYAVLFSSLQKVQGALAANAYRTALVDKGEPINTVELPTLNTIDIRAISKREANPELQTQLITESNLESISNASSGDEPEPLVNQ